MKHIDIDAISTYMGGDEQGLKNFLLLIKKELLKSLNDLETQYQLQDLQIFKEVVHKLKGTALSGGLPVLAGLLSGMSKLTDFDEAQIGKLVQSLREEIMYIIKLLDDGTYV